MPIVFFVVGAAIIGLAVLFGTGSLDDVLAQINGRGERVGPATSVDGNGVVQADRMSLAQAAGIPLPTYALARMVSSEEGNSPREYKVAVAWAAWNKWGMGIADGLAAGKSSADGLFKQQAYRYTDGTVDDDGELVVKSAGAYASTAIDPREDDVAIAQSVVLGSPPDPTGGATNWFRPQLQDKLFDQGRVSKDSADVEASWVSGGLARVEVPSVDVDEIHFFRKVT